MLKKHRMLLIRPRSNFFLVKCVNCGAERVIFSHSTTKIMCDVCGELLVRPTGGRAEIYGEIVKRLD